MLAALLYQKLAESFGGAGVPAGFEILAGFAAPGSVVTGNNRNTGSLESAESVIGAVSGAESLPAAGNVPGVVEMNPLAGEGSDDETESGLSFRAGELLRKRCDDFLSYGSHDKYLGKTENGKTVGLLRPSRFIV
jgi:hypothetical protein